MIHYVVYVENPVGNGYSRDVVYDNKYADSNTEKSVFKKMIRDGMFTGEYELTILPTHPAYDRIHLWRSTFYIYDNDEEVFRGRAVKEQTDKYGRKKITCEDDMKFLIDVPDIFSHQTVSSKEFIYGDESKGVFIGNQIYTRRDERGVMVQQFEHDREFGIMSSARFAKDEIGKRYDCIIGDTNQGITTRYRCTLKKAVVPIVPELGTQFTRTVLYLGNIALAYPAEYGSFDVSGDVVVNPDQTETETVVDFCFATDLSSGVDVTGKYITYKDGETKFYHEAPEDAPPIPENNQPVRHGLSYHDTYLITVYRLARTTIDAMYSAVFCEYTENETQLFGYNKYVPPERRIFAGRVDIAAELTTSGVESCYSNLQKWLSITGGYARVRKTKLGYYVLDLLRSSGREDKSMVLRLGGNVVNYSSDHDVTDMITAIYPIGIRGATEDKKYKFGGVVTTDSSSISEQEVSMMDGADPLTPVSPIDNYPIDISKNIIYNKSAVDVYGYNVAYVEYQLQSTIVVDRLQELYYAAMNDLATKLTAYHSYSIDAVDPRLIGREKKPVLGNYYLVDLSVFEASAYMPLTVIITDMLKPSGSKLTLGYDVKDLADYVAAKKQ